MVQDLAFGAYLAEQRFVASMCMFIVPCSLYPGFGAIMAARGKFSSMGATRLQHGYNQGHMLQSCSIASARWCGITGSRYPSSTEIQWEPGSRHSVTGDVFLQV